jgi:hypothetical protein
MKSFIYLVNCSSTVNLLTDYLKFKGSMPATFGAVRGKNSGKIYNNKT